MILCPYWRAITTGADSNVTPNRNGDYLYEFSNEIADVDKSYCLPVSNLYWELGANAFTNRLFTRDGTHPTELTKHIIADSILRGLHLERN
jgi:lysophospholipase L1-like esterase